MKKKKRGKKAELNLSFGMIFSIILIVVFLAFGFYAIKKFIDIQKTVQIEQFKSDFQNDVDAMWKSPKGSQTLEYPLPTKITAVCFTSEGTHNLKFSSNEIIDEDSIENLDIVNITAGEDPYCIENIKGKVSFRILKDYGETLVRVQR